MPEQSLPAVIFVIDDDPNNIELMQLALQGDQYRVVSALSGPKAFELLETETPDAILLDRMMPEMDGLEVARQLRKNPKTAKTPILMVTALSSKQEVLEGFQAGINDYITKPIDMEILLARLETQLNLQQALRHEMKAIAGLEAQLAVARKAQQDLMPTKELLKKLPADYGIELAASWKPCRHLGGDFYDLLPLADGTLGLFQIDFSGEGVAPSFHTIRVKTFTHARCIDLFSPSLFMARLNSHLLEAFDEDEIAKATYAIYQPDDRVLKFSSSGGCAPLVYRAQTNAVQAIRKPGFPLGAFPEAGWGEHVIELEPGDIVFFYTDGLLKLESPELGSIQERQIAKYLVHSKDKTIEEICDHLQEHIDPFWNEDSRKDDISMMFLRVLE